MEKTGTVGKCHLENPLDVRYGEKGRKKLSEFWSGHTWGHNPAINRNREEIWRNNWS